LFSLICFRFLVLLQSSFVLMMRLLLDANNLLEFQAKGSATAPRAEKPTDAFVCQMAGSLFSMIVLGLLCYACLTVPTLRALEATFNTATDISITASSYTATGEVNFTLGFAPTPGTNLTVIKNTGLPFITGQFSNLANGATVNLSYNGTTYPFVAWYYGGQGNNDLVLLWPYTGLAAWGNNFYGQLGNNSQKHSSVPKSVDQSGVLQGKTIVQVASGLYHCLALCSDGKVAAWGYNEFGQLGDNSRTNRSAPVAVNTMAGISALAGKSVVAVAAGYIHSIAVCSDGTVVTWGANNANNSYLQQMVPVAANVEEGTSSLAGKSVVGIAAGNSHSLALCSDGTLAAWGRNESGQLGDNSTTLRLLPVAVNAEAGTSFLAGKTVVSIAASISSSQALLSDGTVAAWGYNLYGQLGDNSTINRLAPVAVNTETGVSALAGKTVVEIAQSIALCSDGTLVNWGYNLRGELGDNSRTHRLVPVEVNADAGILPSLWDRLHLEIGYCR
jgi:alpha-tubulin suppressor-like RCC1 family protein